MRKDDRTYISTDKAKDTGLVLVLALLAVAYFGSRPNLLIWAIGALLASIMRPTVFTPLARIWFGFSDLLGSFISRILLSAIFFLLVTPVGLMRRATGSDPMKLKLWKNGEASVFADRNHLVAAKDIEKPY